MQGFYQFGDLRVGMRIGLEGTYQQGSWNPRQISIKHDGELDEIEAQVQSVDLQASEIEVLGMRLRITPELDIRDLDKRRIGLEELQAGTRLKIKGRRLDSGRFEPEKLKLKPETPDAQDEIEGRITALDASKRTLTLLGFRIACGPDIDIEA